MKETESKTDTVGTSYAQKGDDDVVIWRRQISAQSVWGKNQESLTFVSLVHIEGNIGSPSNLDKIFREIVFKFFHY